MSKTPRMTKTPRKAEAKAPTRRKPSAGANRFVAEEDETKPLFPVGTHAAAQLRKKLP